MNRLGAEIHKWGKSHVGYGITVFISIFSESAAKNCILMLHVTITIKVTM